jgi:hypothetical protein
MELAKIRQQEMLEAAERSQQGVPMPSVWRDRLGKALIALGQKLVAAANLGADSEVISPSGIPQTHSLSSDM